MNPSIGSLWDMREELEARQSDLESSIESATSGRILTSLMALSYATNKWLAEAVVSAVSDYLRDERHLRAVFTDEGEISLITEDGTTELQASAQQDPELRTLNLLHDAVTGSFIQGVWTAWDRWTSYEVPHFGPAGAVTWSTSAYVERVQEKSDAK